jgi:imidazolonepropionase-like amidohydrolase
MCCREGCDNIKLDVSRVPFYPDTPAQATIMRFEEIQMAVEIAHGFGKLVNAHARSIESIQNCLRAGVDVLYHCEYVDEKTLDMLEEARERVFVAPTVSLFHTMLHEASPWITPETARAMGIERLLDASRRAHTAMRQRGVRHLIGGDYGFAWSMNGTNARDVQFFVDYFGYSPTEALCCATRNGGLLMSLRSSYPVGQIAEGFLADLLLVDGDPLSDPAVLVNKDKLLLIMKDGHAHKNLRGFFRDREAA